MCDSQTPKTTDSRSTAPSTPQVKLKQAPFTGKCGLRNFGQTCYASVVIQTLFACDELRRLVLAYRPPAGFQDSLSGTDNNDAPSAKAASKLNAIRTVVALQELFGRMRFCHWNSCSPLSFLLAFHSSCSSRQYNFVTQEDPNEFLSHLTEVLTLGLREGTCEKITSLVVRDIRPQTTSLTVLRECVYEISRTLILGAHVVEAFRSILSGESIKIYSSKKLPQHSGLAFCQEHQRLCPVFGAQLIETPSPICRSWAPLEQNNTSSDSDWVVTKSSALNPELRGEDFWEIHLGNEAFGSLSDALTDFRFTEEGHRREEWWHLRSPKLWHFTLQRAMWSEDENWKSLRPFQMPIHIFLGHTSLGNRGRLLAKIEEEFNRLALLKRLFLWRKGIPISPRVSLKHNKILELAMETALHLKAEIERNTLGEQDASGGDKDSVLIADKLLKYLRLADAELTKARDRAATAREELLKVRALACEPEAVLSSLWIHSGSESGAGHYWCVVRDESTWIAINDENVQALSEREVQEIINPTEEAAGRDQCVYSAFYEDRSQAQKERKFVHTAVNIAVDEKLVIPSETEATELYEFASLPDAWRDRLQQTALAELSWMNRLQMAYSVRPSAERFLDELLSTLGSIMSAVKSNSDVRELLAVCQFEAPASHKCAQVINTLRRIPFECVMNNGFLWCWTKLLFDVCGLGYEEVLVYRVGEWMFSAIAVHLFTMRYCSRDKSHVEDHQSIVFGLILEKDHVYLNTLLENRGQDRIQLKDLTQYPSTCSPFPEAKAVYEMQWVVIQNKNLQFKEATCELQRILPLLNTEVLDIAFCKLTLLFVLNTDSLFLIDQLRSHLVPLYSHWLHCLRQVSSAQVQLACPEFRAFLRILLPAGYVIKMDTHTYQHMQEIWSRSPLAGNHELFPFWQGVFTQEDAPIRQALQNLACQWESVELLGQEIEICKKFILVECQSLRSWEPPPPLEVSALSVVERMFNVCRLKLV